MRRLPSSFRDPAGFVFQTDDARILRQINHAGANDYEHLLSSGLYDELCKAELILPHQEVSESPSEDPNAYKVIEPQQLPNISYPYEWCFGQLKDAALVTLEIQQRALARNMILKDCSAFNIQFVDGRPVFIDTLSFAPYEQGKPWDAYRQFCQHFLAPLALIAYTDYRLNSLWRNFIDGIPVDLAATLLPLRSRLKPGIMLHLHLHARSLRRYQQQPTNSAPIKQHTVSKNSLLGLADSLASTINSINWQPASSTWGEYYQSHSYSSVGFTAKKDVVRQFLNTATPQTLWDMGANTGLFSQEAVAAGVKEVIAWDIDPLCVQMHYEKLRANAEKHILPLVIDLANPSPALGWRHRERLSFMERNPVEAVMALALVHHLAIGNNLSFAEIAEFFADMSSKWLIIEFVPKDDEMVDKLLETRQDIFVDYDQQHFEKAFNLFFAIQEQQTLPETGRILYLMRRRQPE